VEGTTRRTYRRTEVSAKPPSPTLNPDLQATWRAV
jgi:hypothetical protein